MPDTADEWITVGEAARRLDVHPETVRRRVDDGTLRSRRTKPPKGWRQISSASVEVYRQQMSGELVHDDAPPGGRAPHPDSGGHDAPA